MMISTFVYHQNLVTLVHYCEILCISQDFVFLGGEATKICNLEGKIKTKNKNCSQTLT
jgi:hypothetical protein